MTLQLSGGGLIKKNFGIFLYARSLVTLILGSFVLKLVSKKYFGEDHSIFYATRASKDSSSISQVSFGYALGLFWLCIRSLLTLLRTSGSRPW